MFFPNNTFNHFSVFIILFLSKLLSISSDKLEGHSFQPPFKDVDSAGNRNLGPFWRVHGKAVVNNNFVRVTPDRQSKKGVCYY